ncbi:eggshell protein-like [Eurosta solidaginis]|uniref:eggshell protein-like n=1 Tax=Eurosta solidaginis TaxID=178769 RepID=UPI0035312EDA
MKFFTILFLLALAALVADAQPGDAKQCDKGGQSGGGRVKSDGKSDYGQSGGGGVKSGGKWGGGKSGGGKSGGGKSGGRGSGVDIPYIFFNNCIN